MPYHEDANATDLIDRVGRQMRNNAGKIQVSIFGNKLRLDYCVIGKGLENDEKPPIVLVAGFGSGWRGIAELGYYLAIRGRTVAMVSLPGYGNSENLPPFIYSREKFSIEAQALSLFHAKVLRSERAHWVGHSLGAAAVAELAYVNPMSVASMTLLNPCGFEWLKSRLWLAFKLVSCGILHRLTFRGKSAWKELRKFVPREKSPFSLERLRLRYIDARRMASGFSCRRIESIRDTIPIAYIYGKKDFVTPHRKSVLLSARCFEGRIGFVKTLPLWHNTTLLGSVLTASAIDEFIGGLEN